MKIIVSLFLTGLLALPMLSAQSATDKPAEPQLAYRVLMGYVQQKEQQAAQAKPIAGWTLVGLGTVSVASGVTLWATGDSLTRDFFGTTMDPKAKLWTEVGLIGGGAAALGIGALILNAPAPDFRLRFNDVLTAEDPAVQNRLADATLRTLAEEGRNRRIVSGWVGIVSPVVSLSLTAAINVQNNKPWTENLISINSGQILGIIGGIAQLYQSSPEERLYAKYQAALAGPRS